ncbi:MAG: TRAP transporter small permease [Bacteroidales bacterium]|nr:TRAP transporter small permease [Bacteroidales bacterium]
MYKIKKISLIEKTSLLFLYCGVISLFVLMTTNIIDVISRAFFDRGIIGAMEIESLLLTIVSFLSLAATQYYKRHITVTNIIDLCRGRTRRIIDLFVYFCSVVFMFLIAWQTLKQGFNSIDGELITPIMNLPIAPFQFIGGAGLALLLLVLALDFLKSLSDLIADRDALDISLK